VDVVVVAERAKDAGTGGVGGFEGDFFGVVQGLENIL